MKRISNLTHNIYVLLISLLVISAMTGCRGAVANDQASGYEGYIVDIENKTVYAGRINVSEGKIESIDRTESVPENAPYYLPGLTDSHIHIESSMLTPVNFSKVAVSHGVVNSVSDPHEIANVLGVDGIDFMVENAKSTRFNCYFGLPSCIPSSHLETAGAVIDAAMTSELIKRDDMWYLAEMMNYPGIINGDPEVVGKVKAALAAGKVVDGHAPGVLGETLAKYIGAGISTDHECSTMQEAEERISLGAKIIVREGSAARNFDALSDVLNNHPEAVMLCSDDKHPDDLIEGHIDALVRRGLAKGIPVWNMLQAACINPVDHYKLPSGLMMVGDKATFIAVDNLNDFNVLATVIDGYKVYDHNSGVDDNKLIISQPSKEYPNNFNAKPITEQDIACEIAEDNVHVIEAIDGELFTRCLTMPYCDLEKNGVQKIMVYNRYGNGTPQVAFIKGFDLKNGAMAASIAHDSHNIVAIGDNDKDIVTLVNALIKAKGGVGVIENGKVELLQLPIAGLMTDKPAEEVAYLYAVLDDKTKNLGCKLRSPFITMAFMALPVIPELKITDKGLVDVNAFEFTTVEVK